MAKRPKKKVTKKQEEFLPKVDPVTVLSIQIRELEKRLDSLLRDLVGSRAFEKVTSREEMKGDITELKDMLLEGLAQKLAKAIMQEKLHATEIAEEIVHVSRIFGLDDGGPKEKAPSGS